MAPSLIDCGALPFDRNREILTIATVPVFMLETPCLTELDP